MEKLSIEQQITIKFIMGRAKTDADLRWKLNKYIENGDLSFLGIFIKDLKKEIEMAKKAENRPTATVVK